MKRTSPIVLHPRSSGIAYNEINEELMYHGSNLSGDRNSTRHDEGS